MAPPASLHANRRQPAILQVATDALNASPLISYQLVSVIANARATYVDCAFSHA
jgi:hypothetical protein